MDRGERWIAARDGLRPEMDRGQRGIGAREGSWPEMDRDWIWMDDRRWMTGDGSQELDHGRQMTIGLFSI